MNSPDYSSYTIAELYEALNTIDKKLYPERFEEINSQISNLKKTDVSVNNHQSFKPKVVNISIKKAIDQLQRGSFFLQIISFLFGASILIYYISERIYPEFSFSYTFRFPGFSSFSIEVKAIVLLSILFIIHSGLIVGSIGSYFRKKYFYIIALSWGILTFGFQIWQFEWWPELYFDKSISFKFDLFGLALGFKFNILTSFLFIWSSINVPELRKEIENMYN